MEINSFVLDCIGLDEENKPKCIIDVSLMLYNPIKNNTRMIMQRTTTEAEFFLFKKDNFVEIYLDFKTDNIEFKNAQNVLMKLEKILREEEKEEINHDILLCDITVCPQKYNGKYALTCRNHLTWGIQPNFTNNKLSCIKALYFDENIFLTELTDEEYSKIEKNYEDSLRIEYENRLAQEQKLKEKMNEEENEKFGIDKFNKYENDNNNEEDDDESDS